MTDEARTHTPTPQETQFGLSHINTLLAMDRTLLAWVRTSLSLNAFGFTLAKFIHDLVMHGTLHEADAQLPRDIGITLMVLGLAGLGCGIADYWRFLKQVKLSMKVSPWSSSMILALLLGVVCVALMFNLLKSFR